MTDLITRLRSWETQKRWGARTAAEAADELERLKANRAKKPVTAMDAEIEGDCLVAWNASAYGYGETDTVHPMFLAAFTLGYRAAEEAAGERK